MKVLAVTKTLSRGGSATGARNTILALQNAGAEVVVLDGDSARSEAAVSFARLAERVYERALHGSYVHCLRLGPALFNLEELCERHRPDIVQLFDLSGNTISFDQLSRLAAPVVQRLSDFWPYNGPDHYAESYPERRSAQRWLLERTIYSGQARPDLLIAPSHWLADRLSVGPTKVIRNAVTPVAGIKSRTGHSTPVRFGFISNPVHDPRKGLHRLGPVLEAFAKRFGPVELHLFGKGSEQGVAFGAQVSVHSHPAFNPKEIGRVYSQFDILLCPSLKDNSPNVVTEALSFAVPVIAQVGTGMDTYVEEPFGALIDFRDSAADAGARAIGRLVADYPAASAAALQFAQKDLSPERIGRQYLSAYSELLDRQAH